MEVFFGSEDATSASESEIRAVISAWAESIRQKDVSALVAHFTSDSVRFDLAPPLQTTVPIEENAREWLATFKVESAMNSRSLDFRGWRSRHGPQLQPHHRNQSRWRKGRCMVSRNPRAEKIDGRWLIAHMHESVPFSMDGHYKAEMNLQPPNDSEPSV